ncbi:EP-cadherin-like [Cyprinodon tularosa]|uniref:EP-cadherin-like n=1 Tax=Cyprinodon tularosa TaxID=77115 RepID=UPI0018E2894C|nr:EP-cadherin-like [Cyprinodon tularosa]
MSPLTSSGMKLLFLTVLFLVIVSVDAEEKKTKTLKRTKRNWILPPAKLMENTDYSHLKYIAKIRSDNNDHGKPEYSLKGPGVNEPPYGLFKVDQQTGFITITGKVDREQYPYFNVSRTM